MENPLHDQEKVKLSAQVGYIARGVVYLLVGGLAFASALSGGGEAPDQRHALASLNSYTFGDIILGLLAIGLICFGVWRLAQALMNYDRLPDNAKGKMIRVGYGISSFVHLALALFAIQLAVDNTSNAGASGEGNRSLAATLMEQPLGRWLVGIVGVVFLGLAVSQVMKAVKEKYKERLEVDNEKMQYISPITKIGIICRAVVFAILGYFFIMAAVEYNPETAGGMTEAFNFLKAQPWGDILFGIVALGLIAFAIASICEGLYRRFPTGRTNRTA